MSEPEKCAFSLLAQRTGEGNHLSENDLINAEKTCVALKQMMDFIAFISQEEPNNFSDSSSLHPAVVECKATP